MKMSNVMTMKWRKIMKVLIMIMINNDNDVIIMNEMMTIMI